ncbi:hypothetical protein CL647_06020 [bacterium]|nr:hypothetical protein [bacterium]|tara:strand:+ start:192 stop:848 length:657 start_codon:yes stop_codon:yes gene_type:complete
MQKIPPGNRFTKLTQLASRAKRLIQPGDKQKTIKHLQNKTGCRIQNLDNSINTKIEMINKMEIKVKPDTAVKIDSVHAETGCCFVVGTNIKGETEVIRYSPLMLPAQEVPNFTEKFGPECSVTVFWYTPKESWEETANQKLLDNIIANNKELPINYCESGIKGEMKDQPDILVNPGSVDRTTKKVIPPQVFFITPDNEKNPEAELKPLADKFTNPKPE